MAGRDDEHIQEGDEDRPPRRRPLDEDEDDYGERSRRRRARDDDEDDDDDYDRPRRRRRYLREEEEPIGFLDDTFGKTSVVTLVLFSCLCGIFALLFSNVGVTSCQHPVAKRNAQIVLIVSVCWIAVVTTIGIVMHVLGKT